MTQGIIFGQINSPIKRVQYGTVLLQNTTTNTATITAVNTASSVVVHLGTQCAAVSGPDIRYYQSYLELTNETTVTATRSNSQGNYLHTVNFMVIEFESSIVKSLQVSSGADGTVGINAVVIAKSIVFLRGDFDSGTSESADDMVVGATLVSTTGVSTYSMDSSTVYFTVVEFY